MRMGLSVAMAAVLLGGCQQAEIAADDAWVRLPAVPGRPGAAYFTVRGGAETTSLLAVSTPVAVRTELHEMKSAGGMMTMAALKDVAIPAGQPVAFAPGGKHVMLFDIAPTVRAGSTITLRLAFADGRTIEVPAMVRAAGQEK